jgi:hypothetical protein
MPRTTWETLIAANPLSCTKTFKRIEYLAVQRRGYTIHFRRVGQVSQSSNEGIFHSSPEHPIIIVNHAIMSS